MRCTLCEEKIVGVVKWLDKDTPVCPTCYEAMDTGIELPPDEETEDEELS